jgi:hypothetical protein
MPHGQFKSCIGALPRVRRSLPALRAGVPPHGGRSEARAEPGDGRPVGHELNAVHVPVEG